MLSRAAAGEIDRIASRYPSPRSALLPALSVAQRDFGWLSPEALESVSAALDVPRAMVKGVATFHTMFRDRPLGRNRILLCRNVICTLFGSEDLLGALHEKFGLRPGETTPDNRFSLASTECIGACDSPPAMIVNGDFYTSLTAGRIVEILESYR